MTACDGIQPLLAEWIGSELEGDDAARVRAHLEECATCRAEEAEMREVLALVESDVREEGLGGGVPDPGPAYWAGFSARVTGAIPAHERREKATPRVAKVVWLFDRAPRYAAAALAAAAVLVLALRLPGPTHANDPDAQLAELLASPAAEGIGEILAPPSSEAVAGLPPEDLDRLGEKLAGLDDFEASGDLDDLSPELLEKLLDRLDAT